MINCGRTSHSSGLPSGPPLSSSVRRSYPIDIHIFFRYFWFLCIIVTLANAAIWWSRGKSLAAKRPELRIGYLSLTRGFAIWANVPWIVMGIGSTVGRIPSIFYYFRPQDGDPYVLVWFLSVIFLWIAGFYWLFFDHGAEKLVDHPGLLSGNLTSPTAIKVLYILCVAGGVFGIIFMFIMDVPTV